MINSPVKVSRLSLLACALALSACGSDGGGGGDNSASVGYLTLHGIRGISYQTQSQKGVTDEKGRFRYYPGETISFSLGEITLAQDIPAKQFMSPVQFDLTRADQLEAGTVVDGFTTHREAEDAVAGTVPIANIYRLLATLDDDQDVENGIYITDDALSQINAYRFDEPIDFTQDADTFGHRDRLTAPENRFVWSLCFGEDIFCDDPLQGRSIEVATTAVNQLKTELEYMTQEIGTDVRLNPYFYKYAASDTSIHSVQIIQQQYNHDIEDMEVKSSDDSVVHIQRFDRISRTVEFFADGVAGDQAEVVINIRFEGDYRWFRYSLRVSLE